MPGNNNCAGLIGWRRFCQKKSYARNFKLAFVMQIQIVAIKIFLTLKWSGKTG